MYIEIDDFRQSYVVAKNEIRKFVSGRKFTFYCALIAIIFAMITILPYIFGDGLGDKAGIVITSYVSFVPLLVLLAATLFSSVTIVSEFEERTALILFTRPIKKTSIFLGKFVACVAMEAAIIALYYVGIIVVVYLLSGEFVTSLFTSLGLAVLFIIAASAIAMLISTIMPKGSTSAIMTFITILVIIPVITGVLPGDFPTWMMLDKAGESIYYCIPEYVDTMNAMIEQMEEMTGMPMDSMKAQLANITQSVTAFITWTIIPLVASWILFIKKEF